VKLLGKVSSKVIFASLFLKGCGGNVVSRDLER